MIGRKKMRSHLALANLGGGASRWYTWGSESRGRGGKAEDGSDGKLHVYWNFYL